MEKIVEKWNEEKGYKIQLYGFSPRVVIIGESHHCSSDDVDKQIQLASVLKTDFLLHEFARNYIFDFEQGTLSENPQYPAPKSALNFARTDFDYIPDEELAKFTNWLKVKGFKISLRKYELGHSVFDSGEDSNLGMIIKNRPPSLIRIVGCDVSKAEYNHYEEQNNIYLCTKDCSRDHHMFREKRFAQVIGDCVSQTTKPLIAIVGNYHIKPESFIHKALRRKGLEYLCISQMKE